MNMSGILAFIFLIGLYTIRHWWRQGGDILESFGDIRK